MQVSCFQEKRRMQEVGSEPEELKAVPLAPPPSLLIPYLTPA
jgi:hypothetical protein